MFWYLGSSVGLPTWRGKFPFIVDAKYNVFEITKDGLGLIEYLGRLMKAQSVGDTSSLEFMRGRRVLEINPEHPIIRNLNVRWNKNPATLHIYDMHVRMHSYTHLATSNVTSSNNILTLVCRLHMGVTQMMMML